jgi:methionyl-tRNA formyltransferase
MARVAFLGTPEVAAGVLRSLHDAGHQIAIVVTGADRRRGRGGALFPSPVKEAAHEIGAPVTDRTAEALTVRAEIGVVVAYGRLIRPPLLGGLNLLNLHFSLLPRWRGAAPVERAILAGDAETGVCMMQIDEGLDTGAVYASVRTEIGPEESAAELRARLAEAGTKLLVEHLADLPASLGLPQAQEGDPTYAAKLEPHELVLDWQRSASELHRVVRAGRATTSWRSQRLIVHRARVVELGEAAESPAPAPAPGTLAGAVVVTGAGGLELLEVQSEGRAAQGFAAWANGARPGPGERLGG